MDQQIAESYFLPIFSISQKFRFRQGLENDKTIEMMNSTVYSA